MLVVVRYPFVPWNFFVVGEAYLHALRSYFFLFVRLRVAE